MTEPQREVLRLWQQRQSAKEIALSLGITHWAVNERLRSARRCLGASSSNDAARMLADAEGEGTYKRVVYKPRAIAESPALDILDRSVDQGKRESMRPEGARALREERVPFEVEAPLLASLGFPVPRYTGDRNDLRVGRRLFWIGALAFGIVLAVGALITMSWGFVRIMNQVVRALS